MEEQQNKFENIGWLNTYPRCGSLIILFYR